MGFEWQESIKPGSGNSQAIMKELKDNIDAVYSDLQLSPFSWTSLADTEKITQIDEDDIKELRDAIDYADDMNYCRSHDATYFVTYYDDEHSTYRSSYDAGVDTGYNVTYYNDEHTSVLSSENSGYDATYNSNVLGGHDETVYSTADANYKGTYHSGVDSGDKGYYCSTDKSTYYIGY
ncbi:MAG: hypothetical protein ACTSPB_06285 [Candidatus Thorarchaeota archaeon]